MPEQPDIIFIITDQQRADTLGVAGCDWMVTPNLDRLADDGVLFRNAFCCGATCIASRAALFTGMYAHNTGIYSFNPWAHHRTWLHDLRDAGYHVVNIGKMHHSPIEAPMAFHERRIVENKTSNSPWDDWGKHLEFCGARKPLRRDQRTPGWPQMLNSYVWESEGLSEGQHSDLFTGDMALSWLDRWDRREPLFLQIGFPGPHEPYDPPQRFFDLYRERSTPPRIYRDGELDTKPPEQRQLRDYFATCQADAVIDFDGADDAAIADMRRHYYANISAIDEKVGQILDKLDTIGILEDSIVVFTSDHGDNLGDHDLPYKWTMYDGVVRVPLIVRTPETVGRGRSEDGLISQIDLGPTLLDLAGVAIPSRLDGATRRGLISGDGPGAEAVFCEDNYLTMVRTSKHKLVHYAGQPYGELYDLEADPQEVDNFYDRADGRAERQEMERLLLDQLAVSCYLASGYHHNAGSHYRKRFPPTNAPGNARLQGRFD